MTGRAWGEMARWGLGGVTVLSLHLGVGYWLVTGTERGEVAGLPEAVIIDMAPPPMPEAEPAESPAPEISEPEPAPDFVPPAFEELPPVTDFSELIPDPVPAPDFEPPPLTELPPITDFAALLPESALRLAASDRPSARPDRPKPEPEQPRQKTRREEPPRQQAQKPRPTQQAARDVPRREAGDSPARQGSRGATAQQQGSWQSRVQSRIVAHMSSRRLRGARSGVLTVTVRVSIAASGATSARLVSSTGDGRIDSTLAGLAARMPNMPAPPNGKAASFDLPIRVRVN